MYLFALCVLVFVVVSVVSYIVFHSARDQTEEFGSGCSYDSIVLKETDKGTYDLTMRESGVSDGLHKTFPSKASFETFWEFLVRNNPEKLRGCMVKFIDAGGEVAIRNINPGENPFLNLETLYGSVKHLSSTDPSKAAALLEQLSRHVNPMLKADVIELVGKLRKGETVDLDVVDKMFNSMGTKIDPSFDIKKRPVIPNKNPDFKKVMDMVHAAVKETDPSRVLNSAEKTANAVRLEQGVVTKMIKGMIGTGDEIIAKPDEPINPIDPTNPIKPIKPSKPSNKKFKRLKELTKRTLKISKPTISRAPIVKAVEQGKIVKVASAKSLRRKRVKRPKKRVKTTKRVDPVKEPVKEPVKKVPAKVVKKAIAVAEEVARLEKKNQNAVEVATRLDKATKRVETNLRRDAGKVQSLKQNAKWSDHGKYAQLEQKMENAARKIESQRLQLEDTIAMLMRNRKSSDTNTSYLHGMRQHISSLDHQPKMYDNIQQLKRNKSELLEDNFKLKEKVQHLEHALKDVPRIRDGQYGYNILPPTEWKLPEERPPPCIPQESCPVCPVLPKKGVNLLEFNKMGVGSMLPRFDYKVKYDRASYM